MKDFSEAAWLASCESRGEFGTVRLATRAGADKVAEVILSKLAVLTPRFLLASSSAAAGGGENAHASTIPSRDARILPMLRDEGEERFRSIMETAADSHEKDFDGWPLDKRALDKGRTAASP